MARLFFALWPDAAASRGLEEMAQALAPLCGGRPVPREKIHLTLAFLGEVPPGRMEALEIPLAGAPFDLRVDVVGSFRGAKVAWAGADRPAPALLSFQAKLAAELTLRGFALEERPFAPHATLVRKIRTPVPRTPIAPIEWRVEAWTLVQTLPGTGRYETLREWRLEG